MRLIDADALLEALKDNGTYEFKSGADGVDAFIYYSEAFNLITNAPTVQREGWVSVEDSKHRTIIACLNKISEFCPIDDDVNQLDESPENIIRLSFAEIGDTARCAIAALIVAAPTDTE